MNESSDFATLKNVSDANSVPQRILSAAYLSTSSSDSETGLIMQRIQNNNVGKYKFSGKTMIDDIVLLVSADVDKESGKVKLTVQSENTVLNDMLLKQLKKAVGDE